MPSPRRAPAVHTSRGLWGRQREAEIVRNGDLVQGDGLQQVS